MAPQLQTDQGADQVEQHGEEQEDDGGRLARLRAAEGPVDGVVEHRVGAEPPAGGVPDVDDRCGTKGTTIRRVLDSSRRPVSTPEVRVIRSSQDLLE